jgi:hypothetical protein
MKKTKCLTGQIGIVLCSVLLGAQTGCLPGGRGGLPGLPGLPGPPHAEMPLPNQPPVVDIAGASFHQIEASQIVQNEISMNAMAAERTSHD